jgi:hypothetical protein
VMKMGKDTIDGIHQMFEVCPLLRPSSVHSSLTIHVGTRGENCIISGCVDLKQSICISSHRCSLYYKWRTVRCAVDSYILFMLD